MASFTVANGSPMTTSISGNLFQIAAVNNLATVQLSGTSNSSVTGPGSTINAGTMNATLWSDTINVGQRSVLMKYIAFKQIGSVSASAIQNLKLMIDGAQVGSTASISNSGSNSNVVIFDLTGSPVTLNTGGHTLSLNGDIVAGTSYNFEFTLQQAADAIFYDTNYSVNVPMTWQSGAAIFQVAPANSPTTINSGTISVQSDPTFTATQFVKNASQVALGQWTIKAYGEDVKVQNLAVELDYTGTNAGSTTVASGEGFNNLSVYVNGGQVGSSQSAVLTTSSAAGPVTYVYNFGSTNLFTVPAGTTVTVSVKGDSTLSSSSNLATVEADLITPVNSLQGVVSYTLTPACTVSAPCSTYTGANGVSVVGNQYVGPSQSVTTSTGTLAVNTAYSNQTVSSNAVKQKIGSYVIQASNADGVRVSSLTVGLTGTTTPTNLPNSLANLYIVTPDYPNGTTPVNPSSGNTFSVNFTVPANQTATVDVYADISNVTSPVGIKTTLYGSGVGSTSAQAVNLYSSASPLSGQNIVIGNGTINNPTPQTSSPVASFVIGGGTNQPVATFNFTASNGGATIQELDFDTTNASGSNVSITNVTVGGVTAAMVGASSTVTGLSIPVPANYSGVDVPVTASFAPVGLNGVPTNQQFRLNLIRVKYLSGSTTTYLPSSGIAVEASSNYFDLVGSYPTLTLASSGNALTTGSVTVGSITIAANAAGNVKVTQIPFNITGSSGVTASGTLQLIDSVTGQVAGSQSFAAIGTVNVPMSTDNNIAAGTSKTYNIVVPVTNPGSNSSNSLSVGMGYATLFTFIDVNGNAGLVGAVSSGADSGTVFIVNYPTNTANSHT